MSRLTDLDKQIRNLINDHQTGDNWIALVILERWIWQEDNPDITDAFQCFLYDMLSDLNDSAKQDWHNDLLDLAIEHARLAEEEYEKDKQAEYLDQRCNAAWLGRQLF